jgi:hypothetical protein
MIVFSIRDRSKGARLACFAAAWSPTDPPWQLVEVAGKMNSAVPPEVEAVAIAVVERMNSMAQSGVSL